MISAFAVRPLQALAGALALLALAACGESKPESAFKPVPVTPVLGDVTLGSETAPVTIVEYAAFTCPHCRDFWKQDFPRLKANYIDTGKVKYIYRDYPIDGEGFGVILSSVARCKGKDKFYEMVDALFTGQNDIMKGAQQANALPVISGIAQMHGVTHDEVMTCIDHQPDLAKSIIKSRDDAAAPPKAVSSTPTVFLNDEKLPDHRYDSLSAAIDKKLGVAPTTTTPAAPATPVPTSPAAPASGATPPAKPPA